MPLTGTGPGGVTFYKGRTPPPNLDHLYLLSNWRKAKFSMQPLLVAAPPPTWDSVALGLVGPVKDQSSCGSCWRFSGIGMIEIAFNKAGAGGGPTKFILSEEYQLSCGHTGGCGGDDNTTVLIASKATGDPLTSEYGPYSAGGGRPGQCAFKQGMSLYKIDDWGFCGSQQGVATPDQIKAAIMQYGSVGCAIAADDAFMNIRPGTVFDSSTSSDIDHDIILVGWDDSKGKNGAWKLRNSWGSSWCDGGYCWIGYGVNQVGTESVFAVVKSAIPDTIDWSP